MAIFCLFFVCLFFTKTLIIVLIFWERLIHFVPEHLNEPECRRAAWKAEKRRVKIPVFVCLMSQRLSLSGLPPSHISLPRLSVPPHAAAVSTESWSLHGVTRCWSEWAAVASRAWPDWLPSSPVWRFSRSPWEKATVSLTSRFEQHYTAKHTHTQKKVACCRKPHPEQRCESSTQNYKWSYR